MARHSSGLQLYEAQRRRFVQLGFDARRLHEDIAEKGLHDMVVATNGGVGPNGPARVRWLRMAGHPLGRGPTGLKRDIPRNRRKRAGRASMPPLPTGRISGALQQSMRRRPAGYGHVQSFDVGPTRSAGRSIWRIAPGGTSKMVSSGFFPMVERRWRARNKALIDHIVFKQGQQ